MHRIITAAAFALIFAVSTAHAQAPQPLEATIGLQWTPPTERIDGTTLGELQRYELACDGPEPFAEQFDGDVSAGSLTVEVPAGTYECELWAIDAYDVATERAAFTVPITAEELAPGRGPSSIEVEVTIRVTIQVP